MTDGTRERGNEGTGQRRAEAPAIVARVRNVRRSFPGRPCATVAWAVLALFALSAVPPFPRSAHAQSHPQLIDAVRLAQEGQGDSARARLSRMLDAAAPTDSLYPQILYTMGMVADNSAERQRYFQRVALEYSTSAWADEALFRLAQVNYAADDYVSAARYLDRIRTDFPGSPLLGYASLYAARAHFRTRNPAAACEWLGLGLARMNDDVELRNQLEFENRKCASIESGQAGNGAVVRVPDRLRDSLRPASQVRSAPSRPASQTDTVQLGSSAGGDAAATPAAPARTAAPNAAYRVQIAAVSTKASADRIAESVRARGYEAVVVREGEFYKIRAGSYPTRDEAEAAIGALKASFGGSPFVVAPE